MDLPSPISVTWTGTGGKTLPWGLQGRRRVQVLSTSTSGWREVKSHCSHCSHSQQIVIQYSVPSQILKAKDMRPEGLRGFGISFSRGLDVDGNGYPDFAVGAHKSNQAVLLRARPIVLYQVKIKLLLIPIVDYHKFPGKYQF